MVMSPLCGLYPIYFDGVAKLSSRRFANVPVSPMG